jgi:hypothetical protein
MKAELTVSSFTTSEAIFTQSLTAASAVFTTFPKDHILTS